MPFGLTSDNNITTGKIYKQVGDEAVVGQMNLVARFAYMSCR
jgi:CTP synthase (UTP-ammonia lyase)